MIGFSGLQLDVLKLYRNLLRAARKKDTRLVRIVSDEFRNRANSISKHDFMTIEHNLRYGYKQIKLIEMPSFSAASIIDRNKA